MIEVGATCVGSVSHTYTPNTQCVKGAEKGFFSFGGSTVITVFPKGSIEFENDLLEQSAHKREVFAKMGDKMGSFLLKNTEQSDTVFNIAPGWWNWQTRQTQDLVPQGVWVRLPLQAPLLNPLQKGGFFQLVI